MLGLDLPDGGHISHGLIVQKKRLSAASIFFETFPYHVDVETGLINYEELRNSAKNFKPDIIIAGLCKLTNVYRDLFIMYNLFVCRCNIIPTYIGL